MLVLTPRLAEMFIDKFDNAMQRFKKGEVKPAL